MVLVRDWRHGRRHAPSELAACIASRQENLALKTNDLLLGSAYILADRSNIVVTLRQQTATAVYARDWHHVQRHAPSELAVCRSVFCRDRQLGAAL